ncbi:MAG TPA: MBL fold metallo-hydrolase [Xanthobacteraceae bacterium]|nr:MBL fold metallo-hydrolase [Xanthobacteraceae bacterium]
MMFSRPLGGGVDLIEIVEFVGPTHDAQWMLPDAEPGTLAANEGLLSGFWMRRTNRLVFTYQLWLLKTSDTVALIDTGCGNHKSRISPCQNQINTPVLDWLEAAGAAPDDVTHVIHTHLHSDHVGWNTRLVDGRWLPTFPNATYYMPKLDYELFKGRRAVSMRPEMYEPVMIDSVNPVMQAGLVRFIEAGDEVAGLRAIATPGHTPGHLAYLFEHRGEQFIFAGDVFHSPLQVLYPQINSRWCEDQAMARRTRHNLLCTAAERDAAIFPAHAKGVHGWRIGRRKDGFLVGFDDKIRQVTKP